MIKYPLEADLKATVAAMYGDYRRYALLLIQYERPTLPLPLQIFHLPYQESTTNKLQITISNLKNYIAKMSLYIEDIFDSKSVPKRTGVDVSPEICNTISQKRGYTGCLELYIGLPF